MTYSYCDCCGGLFSPPERDYFGSSKQFEVDHPEYKVVCHVCVKSLTRKNV